MKLNEFWAAAKTGAMSFGWVDMHDERVCPDCMAITFQQNPKGHTWAEWLQFGPPRAGHTICRRKCRCRLVPYAYCQMMAEVPPRVIDEGLTVEQKHELIIGYGAPPKPTQEQLRKYLIAWEREGHSVESLELVGKTITQQLEYMERQFLILGVEGDVH